MRTISKFFWVYCVLAVWASYNALTAIGHGRPIGIAFNIGAAMWFTWIAQKTYTRHMAPVPVKSEDEPDE